jgi:NAD(P)-dependent dehydrogenase (short-subunit alcohol dehydrogenase family)
MGIDQKVAVITGASQGIGAALVEACRARDYAVVATARSIRATNDDQILAVPGDIADRKTAERAISEGSPGSAASIRSSTMPAYSSPSRSLSIPRLITQLCSA